MLPFYGCLYAIVSSVTFPFVDSRCVNPADSVILKIMYHFKLFKTQRVLLNILLNIFKTQYIIKRLITKLINKINKD